MRRSDLESEIEPMVSITVYPVRARPFNFINFYRQWQIVGIEGSVEGTKTDKLQKERFTSVVEKWKISIYQRETIAVSDTNINLDKDFDHPENLDINKEEKNNTPLH